MYRDANRTRPFVFRLSSLLMALALLLCLSASAWAQEAPNDDAQPPAETEASTDSSDEIEVAQSESQDQAELTNPFGHTRTMFRADRMRAHR